MTIHVPTPVIYTTQIEDGSYLAASIEAPRFCVGATTLEEARAKAERAFRYYESVKKLTVPAPVRRTVVTPVYQQEALCA